MLFLCEHESQGIAYLECLSSGLPVLAWDQGWYLDPKALALGQDPIPASSVPFFDTRCGMTFRDIDEFPHELTKFLDLQRSGAFAPRDFVVEHLTLEKCSSHFLQILKDAQSKY
jgi:glycosyltransferase involved in cell wall biosynthesis